MSDESLERLRKRLYKKGEQFKTRFQEPELPYRRERVSPEWARQEDENDEKLIASALKFRPPDKMRKIVFFSLIFVFAAAAVAAIYLFGGFGAISSRNIELEISGPREAAGGELTRWEVTAQNRNKVRLETAELIFHYPKGFRPADKSAAISLLERRNLGSLEPNEVARETFSAYVFGASGFEGELEASLEYRAEGSNAIFEKNAKIPIKISRSPVGVYINIPREVNVGREVNFEVRAVSNAGETIKNLVLELQYPAGFVFKDSSPKPADGQNRWRFGDLLAGQQKSVKISGVFDGQDMDQRSIGAAVGLAEGKIFDIYGSVSENIALRRLFIDLEAAVNSQISPVVKGGDNLNVEVKWKNNLAEVLENATLEVELLGDAIDERTISANQGFYQGFGKKVVWTPSSFKDLQTLNPGSEGRVNLNFRLFNVLDLARKNIINPQITLKGAIRPAVVPPALSGVDVSGKFELVLKLETVLQLSARGLYFSGVLPNSGPLPPTVDKETTYTVVWSLANASSDLSDLAVRAALPPYIRWKSEVRPESESVVFDAAKSEVVWQIGKLKAGTGIILPAKEVMFKVGLVPSPDQIGLSPVLLFDISAEGRDDFTGNVVKAAESSLSSDLIKFDPGLKSGDEKVKF